MKTVVGIVVFFAVGLCMYAEGERPSQLHVTMFPQETYLKEPAAFGFRGEPGDQLEIYLNARKLKTVKFEKDLLELNLNFLESGILSFQTGKMAAKFQLVLPEDKVELAERDGFLYARDLPAILLVRHKHPPKHNRRWEVLKLLSGMVKDSRPVVKSAAVVSPVEVDPENVVAMDKATKASSATWKAAPVGRNVYEVNRVIVAKPPATDVVLFILTGRDLRRGMSLLRYRMRTEWILQRTKDCKHLYLLSSPVDEQLRRNFPEVKLNLSLAARSNNARLISTDSGNLAARLALAARTIVGEVRFQ